MAEVTIIGIDLAKRSFQLHGSRADGSVAFRKKLSREKVGLHEPRCVVALEACGSAHYWGREIGKLGHGVKLVPPVYVSSSGRRTTRRTRRRSARRPRVRRCALWR